jgi:hypothetical protein
MRARYVLLAATLLASTAGAAVHAQEIATYDPRQLPTIQGRVAQYSLTPRGKSTGLSWRTAPRCTCRRISVSNSYSRSSPVIKSRCMG